MITPPLDLQQSGGWMHVCKYIYIYIYIHICTYLCTHGWANGWLHLYVDDRIDANDRTTFLTSFVIAMFDALQSAAGCPCLPLACEYGSRCQNNVPRGPTWRPKCVRRKSLGATDLICALCLADSCAISWGICCCFVHVILWHGLGRNHFKYMGVKHDAADAKESLFREMVLLKKQKHPHIQEFYGLYNNVFRSPLRLRGFSSCLVLEDFSVTLGL